MLVTLINVDVATKALMEFCGSYIVTRKYRAHHSALTLNVIVELEIGLGQEVAPPSQARGIEPQRARKIEWDQDSIL